MFLEQQDSVEEVILACVHVVLNFASMGFGRQLVNEKHDQQQKYVMVSTIIVMGRQMKDWSALVAKTDNKECVEQIFEYVVNDIRCVQMDNGHSVSER